MPQVTGVLETSLYTDDLDRLTKFYEDLFGFRVMVGDARIRALHVREGQVLLLFRRGGSLGPDQFPTHDGHGAPHLAFSIPESEYAGWESRLSKHGVAIESTRHWDRGGRSLYFRDPDNHLLELVTPGCWPNY